MAGLTRSVGIGFVVWLWTLFLVFNDRVDAAKGGPGAGGTGGDDGLCLSFWFEGNSRWLLGTSLGFFLFVNLWIKGGIRDFLKK